MSANLHLVSPSTACGRGRLGEAERGDGQRATVGVDGRADKEDCTPEGDLRALFHAERQAEDVARLARQAILDARKAYAAKHGLTSLPSLGRLREIFA